MALFASGVDAERFIGMSPPLSAFRSYSNPYVHDTKEFITRQLSTLLQDYYVHLPLKQSSLAVNPVQELAVLLDEITFIPTEAEFYRRLLFVMKRLRDRHTAICLPSPWRQAIAYLPFAVESYYSPSERCVAVTKLMADLQDRNFVVGVTITH
jgi:hypothetical protein